MWRPLDNVTIQRKLLLIPAMAVISLALVCVIALRNISAETASVAASADDSRNRLQQAMDIKLLASHLQADLFQRIALVLTRANPAEIAHLSKHIQQHGVELDNELGELTMDAEDASGRTNLQRALAAFQAERARATGDRLDDPVAGATAARSAAAALDGLIAQADIQLNSAEDSMVAAQSMTAWMMARERRTILEVLGFGTLGIVCASMVVAYRIARPIQQLTHAMVLLAERYYDVPIPALAQRDEIGSMARAVQVFKEGMQQADAMGEQQRATQVFLNTVVEHVPASIFVKDAESLRYIHVNRAGADLLGATREEMLGRNVHDMLGAQEADLIHAEERDVLRSRQPSFNPNATIKTQNNGTRLVSATKIVIPNPDGEPLYLLVMIEDVTDRRQAERRIAFMAHYDALTELPNRTLFTERLVAAMAAAQPTRTQVVLMGLDLDHFKEVNDTLGHSAGDALLRMVADRLRGCVRDGDTVGRLGGDEFAIVLCGLRGQKDAEQLADRMIQTISQPFEIGGQSLFVGLSIGIAFGKPGLEPDDLVRQADMALYDAKDGGRGRFRCFVPEMDTRVQQRRALENDLRAAIGTDQFTLHYQPQVDLETGAILGAEALMRWNRPNHGQVPPSAFIPLVEDSGLIGPLGTWLLEVACAEAAHWPPHMHVAVNVSPVQFRMAGFLGAVNAALASSGLDPSRLELEVTEGVLLQDTQETLATLAELRASGVRLSLDDFGTGYSSLSYLQKFRFDKIKIDRSFVRGLVSDPNTSAIVRAVVDLSDTLGIRTNAEGVEDAQDVVRLRALGCREAQGYHFWRPMPAEALRPVLAEHRQAPQYSVQSATV